jgi:hypothetical protein
MTVGNIEADETDPIRNFYFLRLLFIASTLAVSE